MVRQSAYWVAAACAILAAAIAWSGPSSAARQSDVRNTKHNLSSTSTSTVRAQAGQTSEICVFCHTPHAATQQDQGGGALATADWSPALWNRKIPQGSTYTPYTSNTLDAATIQAGFTGQPGGSSKLCLSCHDGTIAVGNVNVLGGASYSGTPITSEVIQMQGTDADKTMPGGTYTSTSGFTRDLGQILTNDHPISVTYNSALALSDGELRTPDGNQIVAGTALPTGTNQAVGIRNNPSGTRPLLPLEKTGTAGAGQIQCATCHDAHIKDTAADHNIKFLRTNRFQVTDPAGGGAGFKADRDIICLACHDKMGAAWAYSTHANPSVGDEKYIETGTPSPAALREFPTGRAVGFRVWEAACLNCHDTHTVQGANKLLREGTDSIATPAKQGGNPAQEQTCYQCHSNTPAVQAGATSFDVPNIATDFALTYKMPITGLETHDVGGIFDDSAMGGTLARCTPLDSTTQCGKDLIEKRDLLGANGNLSKRHVECTDCHNPHRVVKGQSGLPGALSSANTSQKAGTHRHEDAVGYTHTNVISGVLRGSWGVEPSYPSASFASMPSSFTAKRGDPGSDSVTDCGGANKPTCDGKNYVTREYQICIKCHSNYGYDDNNLPNTASNLPAVSYAQTCGTPALTTSRTSPSVSNCMQRYTNQGREFQPPHRGNAQNNGTAAGAAAAYNNNNHRSWHPVMDSTGRTTGGGSWRLPWSNAIGIQTMYCTDCHGSDTTRATTGQETAMPIGNTNVLENGNPWGPHGSGNPFLLKGLWDSQTGTADTNIGGRTTQQRTDLCFKCHNYSAYAAGGGGTGWQASGTDGHSLHFGRIKVNGQNAMRCTFCHVAVPHGWKNKSLLVNLNDVGPEVLCRQEDADDLPTGSKCTVGNAMPVGTQMRNGPSGGGATSTINWVNRGYTNPPYYLNAMNKIRNFRPRGTNWADTDCGSAGVPGNNFNGKDWMNGNSEACVNPN